VKNSLKQTCYGLGPRCLICGELVNSHKTMTMDFCYIFSIRRYCSLCDADWTIDEGNLTYRVGNPIEGVGRNRVRREAPRGCLLVMNWEVI